MSLDTEHDFWSKKVGMAPTDSERNWVKARGFKPRDAGIVYPVIVTSRNLKIAPEWYYQKTSDKSVEWLRTMMRHSSDETLDWLERVLPFAKQLNGAELESFLRRVRKSDLQETVDIFDEYQQIPAREIDDSAVTRPFGREN